MKTVFDFGMYDASDTEYYLEQGFNVVAVEANPALVAAAGRRLQSSIESGTLSVINAAIACSSDSVELTICGDDLGSSSVYADKLCDRTPLFKYSVPGITTEEVFRRHGIPYYLKIDLEGADGLVVRSLTPQMKPSYLSFEVGDDLTDLLDHVRSIGFTRFKLIHQTTFRELANVGSLHDRISRRILRVLGCMEPMFIRRAGRFFKAGHSSGPVPWQSDGAWYSYSDLLTRWTRANALPRGSSWFDLHAA